MTETASIASANDRNLHTILLEEAEGYFSVDKSLEETVEIIQGRTMIYI